MSLQNLKDKMTSFKDAIDKAEEREIAAKTQLKEVKEDLEKKENETTGIRQRILLLTGDLEKILERQVQQEYKHERASNKTANEEEIRKKMEEFEMEGDEKIQFYEEAVKVAAEKEEEATRNVVDARRRYCKVEEDLIREKKRLGELLTKINKLEEDISLTNDKMFQLEKYDEEASEREIESEEKARFIAQQLKEAISRAEESERQVNSLERQVNDLESEIANETNKIEKVMDDIADIQSIDELDDDV